MTIHYATRQSGFKVMLRWRSTAVEEVLMSHMFWIHMTCHCVFLLLKNCYPEDTIPFDHDATAVLFNLAILMLVYPTCTRPRQKSSTLSTLPRQACAHHIDPVAPARRCSTAAPVSAATSSCGATW